MTQEYVFLGHDNSINLILTEKGVAKDISSVQKMTCTFDGLVISSTNLSTGSILWAKAGYATGEIRMFLGTLTLKPKSYSVPIVSYDPANPNGLVWGKVPVTVVANVEA